MKISQIRSAFQDIKEYIKINCSRFLIVYFLYSVTHILAFRFQNSMRFALFWIQSFFFTEMETIF